MFEWVRLHYIEPSTAFFVVEKLTLRRLNVWVSMRHSFRIGNVVVEDDDAG